MRQGEKPEAALAHLADLLEEAAEASTGVVYVFTAEPDEANRRLLDALGVRWRVAEPGEPEGISRQRPY